MAIVEAILQAFAEIAPHKAVAASCNAHVYTLDGVDRRTGKLWTYLDPQFGGGGARCDRDGLDVTAPLIFGGGSVAGTVEAYEIEYPVRFRRFELWRDSGGPGRWRGGLGTRRELEVLDDVRLTARATDRCRIPPPGIRGGRPGAGGGWIVNQGGDDERVLPPKVTSHEMRRGERLTMLTSAGGGCGDPRERDPERVLVDVREGRVSVEAARRDYGVVVDPSTLSLLDGPTRALRAERAAPAP